MSHNIRMRNDSRLKIQVSYTRTAVSSYINCSRYQKMDFFPNNIRIMLRLVAFKEKQLWTFGTHDRRKICWLPEG
jgi:hypothetical protein